jgi:hypothetical protein
VAVADEPGGFLGRWARRKNDALQGKPLQEPAVLPAAPVVAHSAVPSVLPQAGLDPPPAPAAEAEQAPAPALSLDDVQRLTKDSDFKPFMAGNVGPDVRNAAMKKLFADPHFNVMDGLDIYIDDYSISEPIPESMLRQMASAKFLKLFEDDSEDEQRARESAESGQAEASTSRENANVPADESVAHSSDQPQADEPCTTSLSNPLDCRQPGSFEDADARTQDHDHTDLRLQPDDAASGPQAGRCA